MTDTFSARCIAASKMSRRRFLGSTVALSTVAAVPAISGCSESTPAATGLRYLRPFDLVLLRKIAPSILGIPSAQLDDQIWQSFQLQLDRSLDAFGPAVAAEYIELLDLLDWFPSRGLLAGQWQSWEKAGADDVEEFLESWRSSSITVLNKGYRALTAWQQVSWYALPINSNRAGYPGPPLVVRQALGLS
jgi:hypothetical protein